MLRIVCVAAIVAVGFQSAANAASKLQKQAAAIAVTYHHGDSYLTWQLLSPMVAKMSSKRIETLDAELKKREIPTVGQLLVEARMNLIQQGLVKSLPTPKLRERLLVVKALGDRVDETLKGYESNPVVAGTAEDPLNMNQFERVFWDLHVLKNQLLSANRAAVYAVRLSTGVSDREFKNLSDSDSELIQTGQSDHRRNLIAKADQELTELAAELRLKRLDYGLIVLAKSELSAEKMKAAYSTGLDAKFLIALLKEYKDKQVAPSCESLQKSGLAESVGKKSEKATELAGDLAGKSRLLFEGMHWWLRGRYGAGPEVGGLAKSAVALKQPGALIWLYMPKEPPEPADPLDSTKSSVPQFERRHLYTWAWEDRRVQQQTRHSIGGTTTRTRYKLSTFW